jgi:transposase InsO family protein
LLTHHLEDLGLFPSYGSTGDTYDDAATETFWPTLKRKLTWSRGSIYFQHEKGAALDSVGVHRGLPQP